MISAQTERKNVLIVISIPSQFPELFRVAQFLKKSEKFNPIIYFNLGLCGGHSKLNYCLEHGIDVIDYSLGYIESHSPPSEKKTLASLKQQRQLQSRYNQPTLFQKFKNFVKLKSPVLFNSLKEINYHANRNLNYFRFFYRVGAKLKRLRKEKRLLQHFEIKLMVLAEDNEDYFTPQLIHLGHCHHIKSIVFPYTFANQFEFLEDAFLSDRRVSRGFFGILAGVLFPKWTYEYKGKKLLRSYPSTVFSAEIFKNSPPNPWIMSSGLSDVIAVESEYMKEYYAKAGIPTDQMLEIGSLSLDHLYEFNQNKDFYKKKLASEVHLDQLKPWVICALPPYQRAAGLSFKRYQQFLGEFIQFFKQFESIEVLFKFHPRFEVSEIKKTCDKYGIKYIPNDTVELVALGDIYIASVSSTMRWSLALGLPTINYDIYNYNYGDFNSAENYHVVHTESDFKKIFMECYNQLIRSSVDTQIRPQKNFAFLDGQSHLRMNSLFQKLALD